MTETLQFACQPGCSKCCEVRGFVYLTEEDMRRAADFVRMTAADFESKYIVRFRRLLRFRKPVRGQCHFLVDGRCSIHPVKPTQCRLFPFWPELVENEAAWEETGQSCPGIGKGELVQIGTACETASEMKRAYPALYARPK
ncbi:MAG: YkgJ family cysteine cluster protein [Bryobacteraceae bacterium]